MIIEVEGLWKRYPGTWALRDLSFTAKKGRVLGILGENGSGKSTLFRILAGITRPTRGKVRIFGTPITPTVKARIAYLPEVQPYYPWMTVRELLEFLAPFYPGWDPQKALNLVDFMQLPLEKKVGDLSKGQKGRLKVVVAFSWPSEIVLMDEPLGGIDPPSRKRILGTLFSEFRYGEQTILISTHLVSEVEEFIEDVIYLKDGSIVLSGHADQLREERGKSLSELFEEVAT